MEEDDLDGWEGERGREVVGGGAPAARPVRVLCEPTLRSSTPRVYSPPTSAHAGVLSLSLAGCGVVSGVWFILRLLPVRYGVVDSFVWGKGAEWMPIDVR